MISITTTLSAVVLIALAVSACWFDIRERRIPNTLTVSAFVFALLLRTPGGLESTLAGVTGAAILFGLAVLLFLIGALGGGDVKLLTATGALLGPGRLGTAILVMAGVGGLMAIWQVIRTQRYSETAANIHTILVTFGRKSFSGWKGAGKGAALTLDSPAATSVPYGVAIAAGAMAGWFLQF